MAAAVAVGSNRHKLWPAPLLHSFASIGGRRSPPLPHCAICRRWPMTSSLLCTRGRRWAPTAGRVGVCVYVCVCLFIKSKITASYTPRGVCSCSSSRLRLVKRMGCLNDSRFSS